MTSHVGIDLGASYIRVAICDSDGHVRLLPINHDDLKLPSSISFRKGKLLIGSQARKSAPENTAFDLLRVWTPDNPLYSNFAETPDSTFRMKLAHIGVFEPCTKQEVVARLLLALKDLILQAGISETCLEKVVFTIPDLASQQHKRMLLQSAEIAGYQDVHLIQHLTAAAIFYGANVKQEKKHFFMVVNFGGRSISVGVYQKGGSTNDELKLVSSAGDLFGGEDLTYELVKHFETKVKSQLGRDLTSREMKELRDVCESSKIQLNKAKDAELHLDFDDHDHDLKFTLTREEFYEIVEPYFTKIDGFLRNVTERVSDDVIKNVILVGAASRFPKIRELIENHIRRLNYMTEFVPEEVVVKGAAIQSSILGGVGIYQNINVRNIPMTCLTCELGNTDKKNGHPLAIHLPINGKLEKIPPFGRKEVLIQHHCAKITGLKIYETFKEVYPFYTPISRSYTGDFTLTSIMDSNGIVEVLLQSNESEHKILCEESNYPYILSKKEIRDLKRKIKGLVPENVGPLEHIGQKDVQMIQNEIKCIELDSGHASDVEIIEQSPKILVQPLEESAIELQSPESPNGLPDDLLEEKQSPRKRRGRPPKSLQKKAESHKTPHNEVSSGVETTPEKPITPIPIIVNRRKRIRTPTTIERRPSTRSSTYETLEAEVQEPEIIEHHEKCTRNRLSSSNLHMNGNMPLAEMATSTPSPRRSQRNKQVKSCKELNSSDELPSESRITVKHERTVTMSPKKRNGKIDSKPEQALSKESNNPVVNESSNFDPLVLSLKELGLEIEKDEEEVQPMLHETIFRDVEDTVEDEVEIIETENVNTRKPQRNHPTRFPPTSSIQLETITEAVRETSLNGLTTSASLYTPMDKDLILESVPYHEQNNSSSDKSPQVVIDLLQKLQSCPGSLSDDEMNTLRGMTDIDRKSQQTMGEQTMVANVQGQHDERKINGVTMMKSPDKSTTTASSSIEANQTKIANETGEKLHIAKETNLYDRIKSQAASSANLRSFWSAATNTSNILMSTASPTVPPPPSPLPSSVKPTIHTSKSPAMPTNTANFIISAPSASNYDLPPSPSSPSPLKSKIEKPHETLKPPPTIPFEMKQKPTTRDLELEIRSEVLTAAKQESDNNQNQYYNATWEGHTPTYSCNKGAIGGTGTNHCNEHLKGSLNKQNEPFVETDNEYPSTYPSKSKKKSKNKNKNPNVVPENSYCAVCDIKCPCEENLKLHYNGAKHKKKLEKLATGNAPTIKFHCSLCNINVTCQVTLESHFRGSKHQKKMAKIEPLMQVNVEVSATEQQEEISSTLETAEISGSIYVTRPKRKAAQNVNYSDYESYPKIKRSYN